MKLGMRFFRHDGIYRSDRGHVKTILRLGLPGASRRSATRPAAVTSRARLDAAPPSSSAMSSGRLFLDRVARQQSPSPLHRQPHPKAVPGWGTIDFQRTANSVLTVCLSQGDNRTLLERSGSIGSCVISDSASRKESLSWQSHATATSGLSQSNYYYKGDVS